jgi:DNA-binding NarL/FixJ family response regulator
MDWKRRSSRGYLLKDTDTETFFRLLNGAGRGEAPISGRLAGRILSEFALKSSQEREPVEGSEELSRREKDVLHFVADGVTNSCPQRRTWLAVLPVRVGTI